MDVMAAMLGATADPVSHRAAAMGFDRDRTVAVFDLDRTLIPGSSLAMFGRRLVELGLVSRGEVARFGFTELAFRRGAASDVTLERLCRSLLRLAAGRSHAPLLDAARDVGPTIARRVYGGARMLLEQHRRAGDVTVLLSAAPHDLVAEVGRSLSIDVAVGTDVEVVDGVLTGRLASVFCYGPGKVARLEEVLGLDVLRRAVAYADSGSDLALLRAARRPVAVNPDRRLCSIAESAKWPIVRFA